MLRGVRRCYTARMPKLSLSHAAIYVTDLDAALDFYCGKLGFQEHFRLQHDDGQVWLVYLRVSDGQFVELFPKAEAPHQRTSAAGLQHLCFETPDIHELHAHLTGLGASPHSEPKLGADGAWQFWISDPDGMPIEFQQFTPESRQLNP